MKVCRDCRYFEPYMECGVPQTVGRCLRYPPQAVVLPDGNGDPELSTHFPDVFMGSWCGEFVRRTHEEE